MSTKHIPVLLHESIDGLDLQEGMLAFDATFGGGSHTKALLQKVGQNGKVLAVDRDAKALERFKEDCLVPENLELIHGNYADIQDILSEKNIAMMDAILADLGFSSDQIEDSARGLSFLLPGPLDMRLDQSQGITAEEIIQNFSISELARIFREYGEEPQSLKIAKAIVRTREETPFTTTDQLASFIQSISPASGKSGKKIHPATKVFQALRIAVNGEREHLVRFLQSAVRTLRQGGRIAVISFHSGEDSVVKKFFRQEVKDCICPREFPLCRCQKKATLRLITQKGVKPSKEEVQKNPRSRSAVLRIAEKI